MSIAYYEELAPYYKFIYEDWERSVARQAELLDRVIRERFTRPPHSLLDAACGIGTQSIGLAERGYEVTASDISPQSIEIARREAEKRKLHIHFEVADMRSLGGVHPEPFDIVIACDNAVPHLLNNEAILQAFEQFYHCTKPGGGCLLSVRDYANMELAGTHLFPRRVHEIPDGRLLLFDLWEVEGEFYDLTTYVVEDLGQERATTRVVRGGRYYRVTLSTLEQLLRRAGFVEVETTRDRFFQPLIVGMKV